MSQSSDNQVGNDHSVAELSSYYMGLERALYRVENAETHYQVLDLKQSASSDEVKRAYRDAVKVLNPSYSGLSIVLEESMLARVDRAFERIAEAFSTLSNLGKRVGYDNSLAPRARSPLPLDFSSTNAGERASCKKKAATRSGPADGSTPGSGGDKQQTADKRVIACETKSAKKVERRRAERLSVHLPARLAGYERAGEKWDEMAETVNVSKTGVAMRIKRTLRLGLIVYMNLPMPDKLRSHGFYEPTYSVYGIIRRVEPLKDGARIVGIEFLSNRSPAGYLDKPWASFRLGKWEGKERRIDARHVRSEKVGLEYLDPRMEVVACEATVTENISSGGARVLVKSPPQGFELVRLTSANGSFSSLGAVCNRYVARDGLERLCIRFLDRKWPVEPAG